MELYRKIRMNVLAVCCVCSLAIIVITPKTAVAKNYNDALAAGPTDLFNPNIADLWTGRSDVATGRAVASTVIARTTTALSGLGSFLLTRDTKNATIDPKVGKNPDAPYAGSFIRRAKKMRLTAVFISWTFSRTTLVLISPAIGGIDLAQPVDHTHGPSLAAAFCPSFHQAIVSASAEKHNDQSCSLRPASIKIRSDKAPTGIAGPNWGGIK